MILYFGKSNLMLQKERYVKTINCIEDFYGVKKVEIYTSFGRTEIGENIRIIKKENPCGFDWLRYMRMSERQSAQSLLCPVNNYKEFNGKKLDNPFVDNSVLFEGISKCCEMIAEQKKALLLMDV